MAKKKVENSKFEEELTEYKKGRLRIPDGKTKIDSFEYVRSDISEIFIPNGVEVIEHCAFDGCSEVKSLTIPPTIERLGDFNEDGYRNRNEIGKFPKLKYMVIDNTREKVLRNAMLSVEEGFKGYILVPTKKEADIIKKEHKEIIKKRKIKDEGLLVVAELENHYNVEDEKVEIDGFEQIGDAVFALNDKIKELTIGSCIRKIGRFSFADCKGLEKIGISDGVEEIDKYAFARCEQLQEIALPSTLKKLGEGAFKDCVKLKKISIPEGIKQIDLSVFENCKELEKIVIPEGVTVIGKSAFENCGKLEEIEIPESTTIIGESAFKGCKKIQIIRVPSKLKEIREKAFEGCEELEEIELPETIKKLGEDSFKDCSKLKDIKTQGVLKPGYEKAFTGNTSVSIICTQPDNPYLCSVTDGRIDNKGSQVLRREGKALILPEPKKQTTLEKILNTIRRRKGKNKGITLNSIDKSINKEKER